MSRLIDAERIPNDEFFNGMSDKEKAKVLDWFLQAPTVNLDQQMELERLEKENSILKELIKELNMLNEHHNKE